jgi:Uma2 family endonuclease
MEQPTSTHEKICANISWGINGLFSEEEPYDAYGSNLAIYTPETGAHYKPDASNLNAEPLYVRHKTKKRSHKSIVNPLAVFEVFSSGRMKYNVDEKLLNYKRAKTLRYLIFLHQSRPHVVWSQPDDAAEWEHQEYVGLDAHFLFEGREMPLAKLYRRVTFLSEELK